MTDLLDIPTRTEPKRDRFGRYLVAGPQGGKPRSYQRATTFAKLVSDTYNLSRWQLRTAAHGLNLRPDLRARIAALVDPIDADKKECGDLIDQAIEAAQASRGANLGTALHAFTEHADLGRDIPIPDEWKADIDAYRSTLAAAGVEIDPALVEGVVVLDDLEVAGTFDRIVTVGGRRYIADLKTAKDPAAFPHEICIQLALYAHADALYDYSTETRRPMPDVDQDRALVIHLPPGQGVCNLWWFDIAAGWEMVAHCAEVRKWRKRKDLATAFEVEAQPTTRLIGSATPLPKPEAPPVVDEGEQIPGALDTIRKAIETRLSAAQTATLRLWLKDGRAPNRWVMHENTQTRRRFDLHRGAIRLISLAWNDADDSIDDDLARAVVAAVLGDDAVRQPAVHLGAAIGAMTLAEAAAFADLATQLEAEPTRLALDGAGRWTVAA